jgi:hypothetical protein
MNAMQAYVVEDTRGVKCIVVVLGVCSFVKVLIYIACNGSCFQIRLCQLFLLDIPTFHYVLQDSNDLKSFCNIISFT